MASDAYGDTQRPGGFRGLPSFRLHLLTRLTERHAETEYQRLFGLSLLECRVIGLTGSLGALPFKRLCQEAELEKSHASRLVARLTERALVGKLGNPADQRSAILRLTPEGQRLHQAIYAAATERNERWLSVLSRDQRANLLAAVELLIQQVRTLDHTDSAGVLRRELTEALETKRSETSAAGRRMVSVDADLLRQFHRALGEVLREQDPSHQELPTHPAKAAG